MCGRFTLTADLDDLRAAFDGYSLPGMYAPRYNIAPSQPVLAIPNDGTAAAQFFVWGLVPSWAKDPSMGARLINARSETLAEKPAFRGGFKYKRCLILADGFYEWQAGPGGKQPHFIHLQGRRPFALAGLWDEWSAPEGGALRTCTIITTAPNPLMEPIHNRMPVILRPDAYAQWLDPNPARPADLQPLLAPFPAEAMAAYPVSTLVNRPANDRPECVLPRTE